MRHILSLPFLVALLAGTPAHAQDGPGILSPEQIGQIFCLGRIGNDMAPVEAMLTPALGELIEQAWENNSQWAAANPGDKPPLGDGIPWQAWPDYAPQCSVGGVEAGEADTLVDIDYAFPEEPSADFSDRLELRLVEGEGGWLRWRIDNVHYATGGDLRAALAETFSP